MGKKKKKERKDRHIVCVLDIWNGMQELSFLFHKIIYQIISIHSSFSDCINRHIVRGKLQQLEIVEKASLEFTCVQTQSV